MRIKEKRSVWIYVPAVALVLLGGLILWQVLDLESKSKSSLDNARQSVKQASANFTETSDRLDGIGQYFDALKTEYGQICYGQDGNWFAGLSAAARGCTSAKTELGLVADIAQRLLGATKEDKALAEALPQIAETDSSKSKAEKWLKSVESLKDLAVSAALEPIRIDVLVAAESQASAWSDLMQADLDRNALAFEQAQVAVAKADKLLAKSATGIDSYMASLQQDLNAGLKQFYGN